MRVMVFTGHFRIHFILSSQLSEEDAGSSVFRCIIGGSERHGPRQESGRDGVKIQVSDPHSG